MVDKDEIGSYTRRQMAERAKFNYVGFDVAGEAADSDGTYPAKLSDCPCSNRLLLTKKGFVCPGCGKETPIDTEKDEKLKSKHGKKGKNKPFIYSYDPRSSKGRKPKTFYEEDCAIAGGDITTYEERDETPTYDRTAEDGVLPVG